MNILTVSNLSRSYGGRTILDRISFAIEESENVGFIGANGSGKSTLFRLVAGFETADAGEITLRRGARVRLLEQEPVFTPERSIRDTVAEGRPDIIAALRDYEQSGRGLSERGGDERLLQRHDRATAELERLGGWDWMHRIEAMLTRLGVTDFDRDVAGLSGGEARRVALARALLAQPELLLLDEPTNHLDADTVLFLEEYLVDYSGAVMLITHDRYFLDRVVDRMIELADGSLTTYRGGYTDYLTAQTERAAWQATVDAKRRRLIERELDWARRSPPARTGKSRARLQHADRLREESRAHQQRQTRDMTIHTPDSIRLGRTVLDLHGISKSYGDHTLIRDFSTSLRAGERVGVIGPNGSGKTTLVRIIIGAEPADAGSVEAGVNTRIAWFDQMRTLLDANASVYEAAGNTDWIEIGGRRLHLRSYLEDFLFPTERQQQKVSSLSGGERNRLMLAKLFMQPSNLLILDEPTNDLDLVTLQVLEAALVDYPGCVLIVTHDRFFLDKIATALLVFEGNGIVHRHEGGFELYRRLRDERTEHNTARDPAARRTARETAHQPRRRAPDARSDDVAHAARRKLTWNEQRELETIEDRILEAESRRDALAALLGDPELYRSGDAVDVTNAFNEARDAVDALYTRWEELAARDG